MVKEKKTETVEILNAPRYIDRVSGFSRDLNGFINSVEYTFNEDNTINWRAMISPEYLVPNRDSFKNKPDLNLKELDVTTLADNQLLILLAGIKELAQIRGFSSVNYDVLESRPDYVSVKCTINFIPNYETGFQPVTFSALADAHWDNTHNFAKNFLMAIAENRAFVRAVRSFLKVNIVGSDEMGGGSKSPQAAEEEVAASSNPVALLQKTMKDYGLTFSQIKEGAIKKGIPAAQLWNDCDDIAPLSIFSIISGIKSKNSKK